MDTLRWLLQLLLTVLGIQVADRQRGPYPAEVQQQAWGTNECGPCAATTTLRLLGGPVDFDDAKAVLLGTHPAGTDMTALRNYFRMRGAEAFLLYGPRSEFAAVVRTALRAGAYVLPLVWTSRNPLPESAHPETHILVVYGSASDELLVADSLPRPGGHLYSVSTKEFEDCWAVPVSRWGDFCVAVAVRPRARAA